MPAQYRPQLPRREADRLNEKLKDDPSARCAEGHANSDLASAGNAAREKHVGDVRAGDEEHQRDNCHEDLEWQRKRGAQRGNPAASRREFDAGVGDVLDVFLRRLRAEVIAHDLFEKEVGFRAGLGWFHTRLEPSDELERLKELVREAILAGRRSPSPSRAESRGRSDRPTVTPEKPGRATPTRV